MGISPSRTSLIAYIAGYIAGAAVVFFSMMASYECLGGDLYLTTCECGNLDYWRGYHRFPITYFINVSCCLCHKSLFNIPDHIIVFADRMTVANLIKELVLT